MRRTFHIDNLKKARIYGIYQQVIVYMETISWAQYIKFLNQSYISIWLDKRAHPCIVAGHTWQEHLKMLSVRNFRSVRYLTHNVSLCTKNIVCQKNDHPLMKKRPICDIQRKYTSVLLRRKKKYFECIIFCFSYIVIKRELGSSHSNLPNTSCVDLFHSSWLFSIRCKYSLKNTNFFDIFVCQEKAKSRPQPRLKQNNYYSMWLQSHRLHHSNFK